ncbi:MAG: hypothetical protein HZA34_01765 [Candidatus Pacebacteria bacterium]|nr:hypothetical protein [Candidatus Paceibacterota bacterium]
MRIKPYLIVPKVIEQPTWGGSYISEMKNLHNAEIISRKIGQSYELFEHSTVWEGETTDNDNMPLEFGYAMDTDKVVRLGSFDRTMSLESLVLHDAKGTLGEIPLKKFGPKIATLIKLTQAKGNSYQLHVRPEDKNDRWIPKPESWYYFGKGKITLGVKKDIDWDAYKKTCEDIDARAKELSCQVHGKRMDVSEAKKQLETYVKAKNPEQFVNLLYVNDGDIVDPSNGGIHHSWEEGPELPLGNILYEVQLNSYDPVSTIRNYDKGKMGNDGSIREVQVEDYFAFIDRSEDANNPQRMIRRPTVIEEHQGVRLSQIFSNDAYAMQGFSFSKKTEAKQEWTRCGQSFHHLFVRSGSCTVKTLDGPLFVTRGFSVFVPAGVGSYVIESTPGSEILKTYIA